MQTSAVKDTAAPRPQSRGAFPDIKGMSFEAALKELEQIVTRLERGDVELEQSIEFYERGEALRAHCDQLLKRAEAKVERITLNSQGIPSGTAPLDQEI
ncbi:MAG TPA: exodeoxyribonuclease VII small subunit [Hyphomicrobiales bacterium]|nr:exodeoxyribonuclease VII small subunit [Hyphomicrobiales bacterium]